MSYADGSYITTKGAALLARLLATSRGLVYTRVSVGSGTLPDGESPVSREALVTPVMGGTIYAITNPYNGEVSVQTQVSSMDVPTGFYVREIALWARDPDTGGEVLYTYVLLNAEPEWIRPSSAAVGKLATFEIISTVEAQDNVTAIIDPASIAHLSDINKAAKITGGTIGNFVMLDASGNLADSGKKPSDIVDASGKADKVSGATSGHLAALDADGNLTDSGKAASDVPGKTAAVEVTLSATWTAATANSTPSSDECAYYQVVSVTGAVDGKHIGSNLSANANNAQRKAGVAAQLFTRSYGNNSVTICVSDGATMPTIAIPIVVMIWD